MAKRHHLFLGTACLVYASPVLATTSDQYVPRTQHHFAQLGETIPSIAKRYGVKAQVLRNFNALPQVTNLRQGQLISIPLVKRISATHSNPAYKSAEFTVAMPTSPNFPKPASVQKKPQPIFPTTIQTADLKSDIKKVMSPKYNPTGKDISLVVPLKERQFYLGDIALSISKDDVLSVPIDDFIRLVSPLVNEDAIASLRANADAKNMISISDVEATGFTLRYDPGLLELSISLPVSARQRKGFSIANLDREARGNFATPENFSLGLTGRTSFDYIHKGGQTGFADPFVDLNLFGRIKNIAYETEGFYNSQDNSFSRRGSRLIYDDLNRAIRYTTGDVRPLTRGFQTSVDTLGISISRAFSTLQPLRSIRPRGERSFELTEQAFVEILINGRPVRRLRLDAGTYDLTDFPFVSGSNDVRVVIETDAGEKEELAFNLFFDQTMLEPGTNEFSLTAGIAAPLSQGSPDYDFDRPIITGFYRRGLSDKLTLGANIQADENTGVFGLESIWSSPIGAVRNQAALSRINGTVDFAASLDFERTFTRQIDQDALNQKRSRLGISLDYTGESFGRMGTLLPNNRFSLEGAANYSWDISQGMNAAVGVDYAVGRGTQKDTYGAEARLGWRLVSNAGINLVLRYDDDNTNKGFGAFITLSRRFGQNQFVRASYDTRNQRSTLSYTRSGNRNRRDWSLNADLERAKQDTAFNADLSYLANSAEIGLAHRASLNNGDSITDQRTSLRLASTLAYAGGSFAFGRPGSGSFAIVTPHQSLKNTRIRLNPDDDKEYSRSGFSGNAMTTQIGSYSKSTLKYDVDDLPIGYDLGDGNFDLLAPLHAGYKLVVGSDYSISVLGILVNEYDEAIPYLTGVAELISGEDAKSVQIFTNKSGRFGEAFKQGTWRITLNTSPKTIYEFTIPKSATGLYRAGTLTPKGDK